MTQFSKILLAPAAAALLLAAGCSTDPFATPKYAGIAGPELAGAWYQVHFGPSDYLLDARAQMMVDSIANLVVNTNDSRVTIIGKADTSGVKAENMTLSHKRANQVRDSLIADGVAPGRIDTTWTGEGKLTVATANDVSEAANRVVDVTVVKANH
jgi:OOP family OmpA-OmpF porin